MHFNTINATEFIHIVSRGGRKVTNIHLHARADGAIKSLYNTL